MRSEFAARRSVVGESLTSSEAAELLGISQRTVLRLLKSGAVGGLKENGRWRLPAWQFSADEGVVPGLAELQQVFPGGQVALSSWVSTPSVDLDGATPVALLAAGQVKRVLLLARGLEAAAR